MIFTTTARISLLPRKSSGSTPFTLETALRLDTTMWARVAPFASLTQAVGARAGCVPARGRTDSLHLLRTWLGLGVSLYNGVDGSGHVDVTQWRAFTIANGKQWSSFTTRWGGDPTLALRSFTSMASRASTNLIPTRSVPVYVAFRRPRSRRRRDASLHVHRRGTTTHNAGLLAFANPWLGGAD